VGYVDSTIPGDARGQDDCVLSDYQQKHSTHKSYVWTSWWSLSMCCASFYRFVRLVLDRDNYWLYNIVDLIVLLYLVIASKWK